MQISLTDNFHIESGILLILSLLLLFAFSQRCLQEREMRPRQLRSHVRCPLLRVQVQTSVQTPHLQERSLF